MERSFKLGTDAENYSAVGVTTPTQFLSMRATIKPNKTLVRIPTGRTYLVFAPPSQVIPWLRAKRIEAET